MKRMLVILLVVAGLLLPSPHPVRAADNSALAIGTLVVVVLGIVAYRTDYGKEEELRVEKTDFLEEDAEPLLALSITSEF